MMSSKQDALLFVLTTHDCEGAASMIEANRRADASSDFICSAGSNVTDGLG